MRHDLRLDGFRYRLRPVGRSDAAFIVALRTDPELGAFLHPTSGRVEDQDVWIDAYLERAGDFYFIIEDLSDGEAVGTVGIYDTDRTQAEWGRWLVRKGSPAAVESALLVYRAAFELLRLEAVFCRTIADNAKVVSFHDSSGARREAVLKDHFQLRGEPRDAVEHRVDRALWAGMEPKLGFLARRLADHRAT
jgi:RimJ/RimL family protein N-acetyltransferase